MPSVPGYRMVSGPALTSQSPRVRATVGAGTAAQKTWNLRRPVTVIGSNPQAAIVVAHPAVRKAHCVIVNTTETVLLKDLSGENTTLCNGRPVGLVVLNDGDVIQVADLRIQLAIQSPKAGSEKTGVAMSFHDPLRVPGPIVLRDVAGERLWTIDAAVVAVGRQPDTAIHLEHPDVSLAHAVFFYFGQTAAVCDLASRTGTWVNGKREPLAFLKAGDRVRIGPFESEIISSGRATLSEGEQPAHRADDLRRREQALRERERDLLARETALAARADELRICEETLRIREAQLAGQARLPECAPGGSPGSWGDVRSSWANRPMPS